MADPYRVSSRRSVTLAHLSPNAPDGTNRDAIEALADGYEKELGELDDLLYAARQHSLLIVLQGRDTAGKDGTAVASALNASGVLPQPPPPPPAAAAGAVAPATPAAGVKTP